MENNELKQRIELSFDRLISALQKIIALESYKDAKKDYQSTLDNVLFWLSDFMKNNSLKNIKKDEMLDVYEQLENLKTEWLFSDRLGEESELSDEVVIWILELINLKNKRNI